MAKILGFTRSRVNGSVGRRKEQHPVTLTFAEIEAARRTLAGQVVRTPTLAAPKLSALTGATVTVKYENFQHTNSFKERGALNKLAAPRR
jgi:threonine dehydratase